MSAMRVLALVSEGGRPPDDPSALSPAELADIKMERDVLATLALLGHETRCLEVRSDLGPIDEALAGWKPHIVFNMLEEFHGQVHFDQHVVSYLELLRRPYTGCNPRGLVLARDKALTKKILSYHGVPTPRFRVFPRRRRVRGPGELSYPLFVKSLTEEASSGISQASIVHTDEQLRTRVEFIHQHTASDAIAEEYIKGREIYVGVLGNARPHALPVRELILDDLPEGAPRIATARVKFDLAYQRKHGITSRRAENLPSGHLARIRHLAHGIYRALDLSGYARIDLRMREDGALFVLEANPNPDLSSDEDFALAAEDAGVSYPKLIEKILRLGVGYRPPWSAPCSAP